MKPIISPDVRESVWRCKASPYFWEQGLALHHLFQGICASAGHNVLSNLKRLFQLEITVASLVKATREEVKHTLVPTVQFWSDIDVSVYDVFGTGHVQFHKHQPVLVHFWT